MRSWQYKLIHQVFSQFKICSALMQSHRDILNITFMTAALQHGTYEITGRQMFYLISRTLRADENSNNHHVIIMVALNVNKHTH